MSGDIKYSVGAETEKLRPCEVSLYRKTFLARLNHGASVEGADKQGLHACKVWEKRGALNDDEIDDFTPEQRAAVAESEGWRIVARFLSEHHPDVYEKVSVLLLGAQSARDER